MYRRIDSAEHWVIFDAARNVANPLNTMLEPDAATNEATFGSVPAFDFTANGFKIRVDSGYTGTNALNGTYIYAAFAEAPFKYATAR